jgi:hypothetical protein
MKGILRSQSFDQQEAYKKMNQYCESLKFYLRLGAHTKEALENSDNDYYNLLRLLFNNSVKGISVEETKKEIITLSPQEIKREPKYRHIVSYIDTIGAFLEGKNPNNILHNTKLLENPKKVISDVAFYTIISNLPEGQRKLQELKEKRALNVSMSKDEKHVNKLKGDQEQKKVRFDIS